MRPLLIRLRPSAPWRPGSRTGARGEVDPVYPSDSLFSAVSSALKRLRLEEGWFQAIASGAPLVRFSSCFPFVKDTLLAPAPRGIWPPPPGAKVRFRSAKFVPFAAVESLVAGAFDESRWNLDVESGCLLPTRGNYSAPFRKSLRRRAGVDRLEPGKVAPHRTACVEFTADAGLWTLAGFRDDEARERWLDPVKGAFRLLSDTGFGGGRALGWGSCGAPEFSDWEPPQGLLPERQEGETARWLLSLFLPGERDSVNWKRGNYQVVERNGRVETPSAWGQTKTPVEMIAEGSVLIAQGELEGAARDVAPEGFPHPVYRTGFGFALPVAWGATQ